MPSHVEGGILEGFLGSLANGEGGDGKGDVTASEAEGQLLTRLDGSFDLQLHFFDHSRPPGSTSTTFVNGSAPTQLEVKGGLVWLK